MVFKNSKVVILILIVISFVSLSLISFLWWQKAQDKINSLQNQVDILSFRIGDIEQHGASSTQNVAAEESTSSVVSTVASTTSSSTYIKLITKQIPTLRLNDTYNIEWEATPDIKEIEIGFSDGSSVVVGNSEATEVEAIPGLVHGLYSLRPSEMSLFAGQYQITIKEYIQGQEFNKNYADQSDWFNITN